jgi:outer membrane protein assembly factor BamD
MVLALLVLGCAYAREPKSSGTAEDDFAAARREYDEGHYFDAVKKLEEFIDKHPGSVYIDQAIFTLGKAYQEQKDWVLAAAEFERLVRDFPESRSACDAEFALGECFWRQSRPAPYDQTETQRTIDQFRRYRNRCPDHAQTAAADSLVHLARERLGEKHYRTASLYHRMKDHEAAIVYCSLIVSEFGDTRWACPARLMRADLLTKVLRSDEARADVDSLRTQCANVVSEREVADIARRLSRLP